MKQIVTIACIIQWVILSSCNFMTREQEGKTIITGTHPLFMDSANSSCPYFAKGKKGELVLSWARNINDSSALVCYAVSTDNGKTFGHPVEIPASINVHAHAENMPKLLFKPSGEIIAVWGAGNPNPKNPYSGLVFYAQSFDDGKSWSGAQPLVNDKTGYDQRYFDIALLPNGEAAIIWLDNRKKNNKEGSAIYFAETNGKNGFDHEKRIGESCCECCRTDLYIDSKNNIHIAYRSIINDSIRDMVHSVSIDQGKTFSPPQRLSQDNWVINGCPHTGPVMTENKYGLHFAWYTLGSGSGLYFCSSKDNGGSFSKRDSIRSKSSARHPQIVSLPDGEMLITWDETMKHNNIPATCIGLQKRSAEGSQLFTRYITGDSLTATYPVLQVVDGNIMVVAYDQTENDKSHVVCQRVSLD